MERMMRKLRYYPLAKPISGKATFQGRSITTKAQKHIDRVLFTLRIHYLSMNQFSCTVNRIKPSGKKKKKKKKYSISNNLLWFYISNRNVLKATIDVPQAGEVNFHCTHLDHLDENWRMKQINSIIQSNEGPHILAGGLNSLDETDYSSERWTDIVKVKALKYISQNFILKPAMEINTITFYSTNSYVSVL